MHIWSLGVIFNSLETSVAIKMPGGLQDLDQIENKLLSLEHIVVVLMRLKHMIPVTVVFQIPEIIVDISILRFMVVETQRDSIYLMTVKNGILPKKQ